MKWLGELLCKVGWHQFEKYYETPTFIAMVRCKRCPVRQRILY